VGERVARRHIIVLAIALLGCEAERPAVESPPRERPAWVAEVASPDGSWRLHYRPIPQPIPNNALFELDVLLESADGKATLDGVDARMPEHQHGTTLRPEIRALGGGRYRVDGLLLHMSGLWELTFSVAQAGETDRARFEVELD